MNIEDIENINKSILTNIKILENTKMPKADKKISRGLIKEGVKALIT